jgi:hypothetical protein
MQAVVQLVYEKQKGLRGMMRMHGLPSGVYLLVMYLYFALQYLLYVIVLLASGAAAQLQYFLRNDWGARTLSVRALSCSFIRSGCKCAQQSRAVHACHAHTNYASTFRQI